MSEQQHGTPGGGDGDGGGFLNIGKARLAPFTYRSMRALRLARDEAATLGRTVIEPLHVLLGVVAMAEGAGAVVLANLGIVASELRPTLIIAPEVASDPGESPTRLSQEADASSTMRSRTANAWVIHISERSISCLGCSASQARRQSARCRIVG